MSIYAILFCDEERIYVKTFANREEVSKCAEVLGAQKEAHAVGSVGVALRIGQRSGAGKEYRPGREIKGGRIRTYYSSGKKPLPQNHPPNIINILQRPNIISRAADFGKGIL